MMCPISIIHLHCLTGLVSVGFCVLRIFNVLISLCLPHTVKYEQVRGELQSVQRELQRVQDEAKAVITSRERLTQELQTKQAQVCSFEGQLDAARTLNNKLTQEVKRLTLVDHV